MRAKFKILVYVPGGVVITADIAARGTDGFIFIRLRFDRQNYQSLLLDPDRRIIFWTTFLDNFFLDLPHDAIPPVLELNSSIWFLLEAVSKL
jgi:hypothetical protein